MNHKPIEQSNISISNITSNEYKDTNKNETDPLQMIIPLTLATSPTNIDNTSHYLPASSKNGQINPIDPKKEHVLNENMISYDYITNEARLDEYTSKKNTDLRRKVRMIRQEELMSDFDVKTNNLNRLKNKEEISSFLYYSVAVIKDSNNLTSFDDLKGTKSCHGSVTSPSGK